MAIEEENTELNTVDNTVENTTVDTDQAIRDTVQVEDLTHENKDLDSRLDALAGIKKPDAATKANTKNEVQQGQNPNTAAGKGKKPEERPTAQEQRPTGPSYTASGTPRSYGKNYQVDRRGNVVDAVTGQVVATAGSDRRAFERVLPTINQLRTDLDKYQTAYESAMKSNTAATSLGISPEEHLTGGKLIRTFKTDPKSVIKYLLTEAQDSGIDVSDIVAGGGGGPSITAIEQKMAELIESKLAPLMPLAQTFTQNQESQRYDAEIRDRVGGFLNTYPDAEIHGESIALLMQHAAENGDPISMETAYLRLQNHSLKSGFDWNQPLPQQILAMRERANTNGASSNTPTLPANAARLPPMNGRGNSGNIVPRTDNSMSGLEDSSNIVKEAMRAAGMAIE